MMIRNTINNRKGIIWFSAGYLIILLVACCFFLFSGLTLVRNGDAYTQHFPAFMYIGKYYRDLFHNLAVNYALPNLWDFSIGYGFDIPLTLSYYGMFDWSTIIFAIFSNEANGAELYTAMILFRTYLAGLFFILFCEKHECSEFGSTIAAYAYIFCPYMLENVFNGHHFFGLPLFYLPLILLLLEKILRKEKISLIYIITVFTSILSSYYFFYMEMICAVLYFICRYFCVNYKPWDIFGFFRQAAEVSIYTLIGMLISMFVILPVGMELSTDVRLNSSVTVPILYSIREYQSAIGNFLSSDSFNYYSFIGISPVLLIGIYVLFSTKKDKGMILLWSLSLVSCFIPLFGYFMNGCSYTANRHVWIYSMFTAFAFAFTFDELFKLRSRQYKKLIIFVLIYGFILLLSRNFEKDEVLYCFGILALGTFLLCGLNLVPLINKHVQLKISMAIISLMVVAGIVTHGYYTFIDRNGISSFLSTTELYDRYASDFEKAYTLTQNDESAWRMDWNDRVRKPNMINNNNNKGSTYAYWGWLNSNLVNYLDYNGLLDMSFEFKGLDRRRYLQAMNAVKYVAGLKSPIEEGYSVLDDEENIFINDLYFPIVRLYNRAIEENDYEKMTFGQREKAQLIECVTNDARVLDRFLFDSDINKDTTQRNYYVKLGVNTFLGNKIIIKDEKEPLSIRLDCPANNYLYLELFNLKVVEGPISENLALTAECDNNTKTSIYFSSNYRYYFGKNDYLFNFGYSDHNREYIQLWFDKPGIYQVDSLIVEYDSYETFRDIMASEKGNAVEEICIDNNYISTEVNLDEERIVYFSIPFSTGWKMFINGVPKETFRANIMGTGVFGEKGYNYIEMKYCTPFLKEGALLSLLGLAGLLIVWKKYHSVSSKSKKTRV